jgi:hypothetical protein
VFGLIQRQLATHHHPARRGAGPFRTAGLIAAEQGADALDQQPLGERLGYVVVGAKAEAHQFVHFLVLRGEEDDRHRTPLPQFLK